MRNAFGELEWTLVIDAIHALIDMVGKTALIIGGNIIIWRMVFNA